MPALQAQPRNPALARASFYKKAKRPRGRPPRPRHPTSVERDYFARIDDILKRSREAVHSQLMPMLDFALSSSAIHADSLHLDDAIDEIKKIIDKIRADQTFYLTQARLDAIAQFFGVRTMSFSAQQVTAQVKAITGLDITAHINEALLKSFAEQNATLIKDVSDDYLKRVQNTVSTSYQLGERADDVAKKITDDGQISKRRAALIARDQIGKLYGATTKQIQSDLGIEEFIWRTSRDSRVRQEHKEREGKKYSWKNPPNGEIPGSPINCRCTAEPVLDHLLA